MKFMLDGCDISFVVEAPNDITLEQLLKQTDKIKPDYCACGIRSLYADESDWPVEIAIGYNWIEKKSLDVACQIKEDITMDKHEIVMDAQSEANIAKERLMRIADSLYEAGAIRQAKSLETIIEKLEIWQNK